MLWSSKWDGRMSKSGQHHRCCGESGVPNDGDLNCVHHRVEIMRDSQVSSSCGSVTKLQNVQFQSGQQCSMLPGNKVLMKQDTRLYFLILMSKVASLSDESVVAVLTVCLSVGASGSMEALLGHIRLPLLFGGPRDPLRDSTLCWDTQTSAPRTWS